MNKFPVVGLDNAGKTSIILAFQRQFKAITKIKPTKRIQRTSLKFLDNDIFIWDFGGQDKYRKKYFNNPEMNFEEVDDCFFVVDIQDEVRLPEMVSYFQLIRTSLMEYSPDARLNLLLHKYDPEVVKDTSYEDLADAAEEKFTELAKPLNVNFYRTSIFNPLTIIQAFSKAILGNNVIRENLNISFEKFVKTNALSDKLLYIMVFSENFLEIGSYVSPDLKVEQIQSNTLKLFAQFEENNVQLKTADLTFNSDGVDLKITREIINSRPYYYIFGYNTSKISDTAQFLAIIEEFQLEIKKMMLFI